MSISEKFYDDPSGVETIGKANSGVSEEMLEAGLELIIPDISILYEIASKVFRDGKRWTVIYVSNKNEIKNVKDLPVGQVIIIPLTVLPIGFI